jgi:predicted ATPase
LLKYIRIKNFKCFKENAFELKPLTVLTGINGAGKSSLIQALLLLAQSYEKNEGQLNHLILNGDLTEIGTSNDALYQEAEDYIIEFEIGGQTKNYLYEFKCPVGSDRILECINHKKLQPCDLNIFKGNLQYLKAERVGARTFFGMSNSIMRQNRKIGISGEYTTHYLSLFGRERIPILELCNKNADSLDLVDQVEAWLGEISPGIKIKIDSYPGMDLVNLSFYYSKTGKALSNDFRATNVGFGITYVMPIFTALLSAQPGSLVILENPEAHLHPQGQALLGKFIAKAAQNGVQIILETHSDHIINGIRIAAMVKDIIHTNIATHFFAPGSVTGGIEIHSPGINERGRYDLWPDGFFDEWDKALEELL